MSFDSELPTDWLKITEFRTDCNIIEWDVSCWEGVDHNMNGRGWRQSLDSGLNVRFSWFLLPATRLFL